MTQYAENGGGERWTDNEDAVIREHYGKAGMSAKKIADLLPNRTRSMVLGRAQRLGLSVKNNRVKPKVKRWGK